MKLTLTFDLPDGISPQQVLEALSGLTEPSSSGGSPTPPPLASSVVRVKDETEGLSPEEELNQLREQITKKATKTTSLSDGTLSRVGDTVYNTDTGDALEVIDTYRQTIIGQDAGGLYYIVEAADLVGTLEEGGEPDEGGEVDRGDDADNDDVLSPGVSYDDLHALAASCVKAVGGAEVKRIVSSVQEGAARLSQLDEKNWETLYTRLKAVLEDA